MSHRTSQGRWGMRVATWAAVSAAALGATTLHLRAADDDKPEDKKPAIDPAEPKPNPKPGPATKPIVVRPGDIDRPDNKGELLLPTTRPSTKPATAPTTKKTVDVSPEVRAQLDKVRDAYKALKSLKVAGTITSDIDVNGLAMTDQAKFDATFEAPLKFRHRLRERAQPAGTEAKVEWKDSMIVGGTGSKLYVFQPQYNYYYQSDAPKERGETLKTLGGTVAPLLESQNLSLELALLADASAELLANIDKIEFVPEVKVGDVACPAVRITVAKAASITVAFDPKTNLVRRAEWDRKAYAEERKQQDVKKVLVTIDYTTTEVDASLADEKFAWSPPLGARDVTALANAGASDDDDEGPGGGAANPAAALVGQPAPDFSLKTASGEEVKLSDLKGSVVLLDFWATWCGPCVQSLPHLDAIYKELGSQGLKAYAVNLREKPEKVAAFVEKTKLGIPVLFDTDGKVAKSFKVSGIPQTVVVGKDGVIKAVVVGSGTHEKVKAAIVEALK